MIAAPEKLSIFLNNSHIGNLAITPNNLAAFEYTPEYLSNGVSISPFYLPLQSGVFIAKPEPFLGMFGIFNDSLPDGWGKLLTDRLLKKHGINPSQINNMQRLSLVGKNGIGALNYSPQWELSKTSGKIDLDIIAQEVKNILNNSETDIETLYREGGSLGGARPKVFYKYGNTQWIVKFKASIDPINIGQLEYDYSITARKCGIIMSQTQLFNGKYFGVKRFDIGEKEKFLIHSASGLLYASYRLPSLDYIDLIKATLALTQSMEEALKIFRQMVFNIFTYNKDDHAKNFSFILKDKQWKVSPAYDLVFSDGFNGQHTTTINGKGNPALEDIMEVAKQTGIPLKKAAIIINEVRENTTELIKQLQFQKII